MRRVRRHPDRRAGAPRDKRYAFTGTQREELFSEKITWSNFSKQSQKLLLQVEHVEKTAGAAYDKMKEIKDGVLKSPVSGRLRRSLRG